MRASFWVIAPLGGPLRPCQGLDAGRMRHRHPSGRPAHHGARQARRRDRDRQRLCGRHRSEGPDRGRDRLSQGDGRRHPCGPDGGDARSRNHRDPQRRPRAGGGGSGRVPDQDGRQDRRRRHLRDRRRGRRSPQRRVARRDARPHRDRHLCHGGRHDRRRPRARQHPAGLSPGRPRRARPGRGPK